MTGNRGSGPPLVSAIVINWNTRDHLNECLASLLSGGGSSELEVIAVDNNSPDGSAEMVRQKFPSVTLIENDRNLMFAGGVNSGLKRARGKYFFILNPDVLITPDSIAELAAFMDEHPDVAAASPALFYPGGEFQSEFFLRLPSFMQLFLYYTPLYSLARKSTYLRSRYYEAALNRSADTDLDQLPGGCMLVSRTAVEAAGPMDEDFVLYYEDVDWCTRLSQHGRLVLHPGVSAVHHGGGSHQKDESWVDGRFKTSMLLYFKKHLGPVSFRMASIVFFGIARASLMLRSVERFLPMFDQRRVANRIEKNKFFLQEYRQRQNAFAKY